MLTSRNAEFYNGQTGGEISSSLQTPTGIAINSVLQQYMPSEVATNTASNTDQGRATPGGLLPTKNGYGNTYGKLFPSFGTRVGY